jgi:hypothetical protein
MAYMGNENECTHEPGALFHFFQIFERHQALFMTLASSSFREDSSRQFVINTLRG